MRLAHKRNVQLKLNKKMKAVRANIALNTEKKVKKAVASSQVTKVIAASQDKLSLNLTPKQQEIYDILMANDAGLSPKNIGLKAGQEDAKAAAWATGGLRKMLADNLVIKEQLAGNKVSYKIA